MPPTKSLTPKRWPLLPLLVSLLLGGVLGVIGTKTFWPSEAAPPLVIATAAPIPTMTPTATPGPILVYVSGAVRYPAVYRLPPGSRVNAIIKAAGGPTTAADLRHLNLAAPLVDGQQVHVPANNEVCPPSPVALVTTPLSTITKKAKSDGKVDINHASVVELETLPGVGPAMAARIIAGRPYSKVEDLKRVKGIGDKTLEKLQPFVEAK